MIFKQLFKKSLNIWESFKFKNKVKKLRFFSSKAFISTRWRITGMWPKDDEKKKHKTDTNFYILNISKRLFYSEPPSATLALRPSRCFSSRLGFIFQ